MKLTGTNRSKAWIAIMGRDQIKQIFGRYVGLLKTNKGHANAQKTLSELGWPGGYSASAPPDPIPNSAVKPCCADGTSS